MENAINANTVARNRAGELSHIAPALAWALAQSPGSAIDKLVLIALAERYDWRVKLSFPSRDWIVEWAGVNRKTAIRALRRLEANGYIEDSGHRVGRTGQTKAYHLKVGRDTEVAQ